MIRRLLWSAALVVCFAGAQSLQAAIPSVGQPAPPLILTDLLNAPQGATVDWATLKGKVVVLEFWATWCAPCIAEIPHLNALAESVAGNNVQFISVDDEDVSVIREFLAKKKMAGWAAVSKQVFTDYGVQQRPTTVVVDPQGKIAAVLRPEQLEKDPLVALANGKPAVFSTNSFPPELAEAQRKAMMDAVAAMKNPAADSPVKPLFEISITAGKPDGVTMMSSSEEPESGHSMMDMRNASLGMLIPWALGVPMDRVTFHGDLLAAHYNLHLSAPKLNLKLLTPALETAIEAAGNVKLTHYRPEEDAYVLEATDQAKLRLKATVSNHGHMCFLDPRSGSVKMVNTSLEDMATVIEQALNMPVLNETGIPGAFDADFVLPKESFETTKAALETNLGLTLVKRRGPVERIVVDAGPGAPKSGEATIAGEKSAAPAGMPAQVIAVPRQ